jgi:hypothetical protein
LTSVVSLKLSIYDPTGTCLLYQEQQANIDLSQTNGTFAVQVGSALAAAKRTTSDQGLSMPSVFANNGQIIAASTLNCTAGYTPAANDNRLLRVAVTNGGSTVTISPDLQINSVPNSLVAETLQGYTPTTLKTIPGSISSTGTNSYHHEFAQVASACSSSPCTIAISSGAWVSSITRPSIGNYTANFTAGEFTTAPACTVTMLFAGAWGDCTAFSASTSSVSIDCSNSSRGSFADQGFTLTCDGR